MKQSFLDGKEGAQMNRVSGRRDPTRGKERSGCCTVEDPLLSE